MNTSGKPVELDVLGEARLRVNGVPCVLRGRLGFAVLAILALADVQHTRLSVADLIWDDQTQSALHNLRMALSSVRRALGEHADVLVSDSNGGQGLKLDFTRVRVDVRTWEDLPNTELLRAWRGPLLAHLRSVGSDAWLDWIERTEGRLLTHFTALLLQRAETAPAHEAEALARLAVELRPLDPLAASALVRALRTSGRWSDAALFERRFQQRLKQEFGEPQLPPQLSPELPSQLPPQPPLQIPTAQPLLFLPPAFGNLHRWSLNAPSPSITSITPTIPSTPSTPSAAYSGPVWPAHTAEELVQAAHERFLHREHREAETLVRQALSLKPGGATTALAYNVLSNVALDQGRVQDAQRLVQAAMRATPDVPLEVSYSAAYLQDLQGSPLQAQQIIRRALRQLDSGENPALLQAIMASTLDTQRKFKDARAWHEAALTSARRSHNPHLLAEVTTFAAWHLNATGNAHQAAQLTEDALLGLPHRADTTPYLHCTLGDAMIQKGELDRAVNVFHHVQNDQDTALHVTAQARLASCLHQAGETTQALLLLHQLLPTALGMQAGNARLEWAIAALKTGDPELQRHVPSCIRGAKTNNPTLLDTIKKWTAQK